MSHAPESRSKFPLPLFIGVTYQSFGRLPSLSPLISSRFQSFSSGKGSLRKARSKSHIRLLLSSFSLPSKVLLSLSIDVSEGIQWD